MGNCLASEEEDAVCVVPVEKYSIAVSKTSAVVVGYELIGALKDNYLSLDRACVISELYTLLRQEMPRVSVGEYKSDGIMVDLSFRPAKFMLMYRPAGVQAFMRHIRL